MNRRLLLAYVVLAAAAAGLVSVAVTHSRQPSGRPVQAAHPERRRMEDIVYASGRVSPRRQQQVMPQPGMAVESIPLQQGQAVKKGDVLMVLEAMKMQVNVAAPKDGVIRDVPVAKGDVVEAGDLLAVYE